MGTPAKVFLALLLATTLVVAGVAMATGQQNLKLNASNTVIVLPTTKVVNSTPIHINEDAIAGSKLSAWIEYSSLEVSRAVKNVTFEYTVHSAPIHDDDSVYYLLESEMPDAGISLSKAPTNRSITIMLNLSKVRFDSTRKEFNVSKGAVKVMFLGENSPINLGLKGKYVVANANMTEIIAYNHTSIDNIMYKIGSEIKIDGWTLKVMDIDNTHGKVLFEVVHPTGKKEELVAYENTDLIWYVKGGTVYTETNVSKVDDILKDSVDELCIIRVGDIFSGIESTSVAIAYEYWTFDRKYADGEAFSPGWVWDILTENEFAIVYNKTATIGDGEKIPLPFYNLTLTAHVKTDSKGNVTDEYLTFDRTFTERKKVETISNVHLPKPYGLVITDDEAVNSLPASNIVVIGGWVSNKFWSILEKYYPDKVAEMKKDVMDNGYVIEILPHPTNKNYKVIVIAGKTYKETAKAVDEFIKDHLQ